MAASLSGDSLEVDNNNSTDTNVTDESVIPEIFYVHKIDDKGKKNLIEALREYPCLWNTRVSSYKDK